VRLGAAVGSEIKRGQMMRRKVHRTPLKALASKLLKDICCEKVFPLTIASKLLEKPCD